jgi:hypothetical protein
LATVRILHPGGVGEYKQGDIGKKPSSGLLEIAEKGIRNAADGELLAEIVDEKAVKPSAEPNPDK